MWAVMKKELKSYFYSPIGYVFIGLFLAIFSFIFYITTISQGAVTYQYVFFYSVMYIVIFLIPLLTMRTFSEERKNGTEQILMTSPRSTVAIVLGKFLAALVVIAITELFTLIYFGIICYFKTPDIPTVLVTMFGFLITSMAYISLGMFISSLTENQIIAGVITIAFMIITLFTPDLNIGLPDISIMSYYQNFPTGVISLTDVAGPLTLMMMFIAFTIIVMQRRKLVK